MQFPQSVVRRTAFLYTKYIQSNSLGNRLKTESTFFWDTWYTHSDVVDTIGGTFDRFCVQTSSSSINRKSQVQETIRK